MDKWVEVDPLMVIEWLFCIWHTQTYSCMQKMQGKRIAGSKLQSLMMIGVTQCTTLLGKILLGASIRWWSLESNLQ